MPPVPRSREYWRALLSALAIFFLAGLPARAQGRLSSPGFAWCGGAVTPADFAACRAAGFNAVRLDVPWTSKPAWEELDRRIAAAQEQHLQVILSLQMTNPPAEAGAVDAGNAAYAASLKAWIDRVAEHFRGSGAVLAWMTPEEPETALQLSDSGFRKNIAERYRDIKLLNRAWGTRYQGFNAISASAVVLMARQPQCAIGLNRAGMDLALYKQDAFVRLLQLWARYLRAADPDRPVLAGAMGRYRCLISTPEEYDGVVARVLPGGAGPAASEAVAIAGRGGRFAAIASLPTASLPDGFRGALLHGATGIAVEDWRAVSGNPRLRALLTKLLADWRASGCFTNRPAATAAILYEPYGDSFPNASPLFTGYLSGADAGDLDPLFTAFRQGTSLGQVDVVGREEMLAGTLSRYRVLFCPMLLTLNDAEVNALFRYAETGGVVVADGGIGSYETGGTLSSWSVQLATLLGIHALYSPMPGSGTLRVFDKLSLFPSLQPGLSSIPGTGSAPFRSLAALIEPLAGSTPLAAVVDRTMPGRRLFGGILVHPVGKGFVVFASMKLWEGWSPADPLFALFHRDLLARAPRVALRNAVFIGDTLQVAAFARGVMVSNTGNAARLTGIDADGDELLAGSCLNICQAGNKTRPEVQAGIPAQSISLLERVPIRCEVARSAVTVAVDEYGPNGIKITVCGGKPRYRLNREGRAVMTPTFPQDARLILKDGRYALRPGSLHRLQVKSVDDGKVQTLSVRVGAEGQIELSKTFYCEVLTLTPIQDAGSTDKAQPAK